MAADGCVWLGQGGGGCDHFRPPCEEAQPTDVEGGGCLGARWGWSGDAGSRPDERVRMRMAGIGQCRDSACRVCGGWDCLMDVCLGCGPSGAARVWRIAAARDASPMRPAAGRGSGGAAGYSWRRSEDDLGRPGEAGPSAWGGRGGWTCVGRERAGQPVPWAHGAGCGERGRWGRRDGVPRARGGPVVVARRTGSRVVGVAGVWRRAAATRSTLASGWGRVGARTGGTASAGPGRTLARDGPCKIPG